MPFKKGNNANPRGRPKGAVNKTTKTAREAFQLAFEGLGGAGGLQKWAQDNQQEFYKLYARLIPVEHTGEGGTGPIATTVKHIYETQTKP